MKQYICKEVSEEKIRIKIIIKDGRERAGVEHIGITHNEAELRISMASAKEKLCDKSNLWNLKKRQ